MKLLEIKVFVLLIKDLAKFWTLVWLIYFIFLNPYFNALY